MAALNLGRTLNFNSGSQDALLRSVKSAQFNYKHTGKVDNEAINQILNAVTETYDANNQYQLELTSKNNDALVDKIKSIIIEQQNINDQTTTNINEYLAKLIDSQNEQSKKLQDTLKEDFKNNQSEDIQNNSSDENKLNEISEKHEETNELIKSLQNTTWSKLSFFGSFKKSFSVFSDNFQKSFQTINSTFKKINPINAVKNAIGNVNEKIAKFTEKLNPINAVKNAIESVTKGIGNLVGKLNPLNLLKRKKKKKPTKDEIRLSKMIDKVNDFIDNFVNKMSDYAQIFLNKFLSQAKTVVNKLMTHIFAWLLVNVVLIGLLLGIVLKLIADPLMKILQPIMDFIENVIDKVLEFLKPVRDFLLDNFQKIIDNVILPLGRLFLDVLGSIFENVLKPFFEGIGTVAKALGVALGKLIIGIADFFVDTLLPFLKDKLLPILGVILDILKEFFEAIKPYIKPLVDIVVTALIEVMTVVKELFIILKPVIIELGKFLAGVFMDILKGIDWVYKNIVKPIISGIGKFLLFLADAGKILWMKIKAALPSWAGGEDMNKQREEALKEVARLKNEIAKGHIKNDEEGWDNVKALEEMNKKLKFLNAETGNNQVDVTQDVDQLKTTAEEISQIPEATVKDLAENVNVINDMYKVVQKIYAYLTNDSINIDNVETEKIPNVQFKIDEDQSIKNEKQSESSMFLSYINDNFNPFMDYMIQFTDIARQNFEHIIEKLDDKPDIMPIPLFDNGINPAALENN